MQAIKTDNFSFDPATGKLELLALGQVLSATIRPEELERSLFVVPYMTARLLQPLQLTIEASWHEVETAEGVELLTAQEACIHLLMAYAFWWATQRYNTLESVKLMHFLDMVRMADQIHEANLAKKVVAA